MNLDDMNFIWEIDNFYTLPKPFDSENANYLTDLNIKLSSNVSIDNKENNYYIIQSIQKTSSSSVKKNNESNEYPKGIKNLNVKENKKILGRKRKDSETEGFHTKYKEDNMIRKAKVLFKDSTIKHINKKIKEINDNLYVNINGKEYKLEKILDIKQDKIVDINALSNRELLAGKVKDLLSEDISGRYKNIPKDFNKIAIDKLYEYDNETIISILETKLLDCIKFLRKDDDIINDENFAHLKGLEERYEKLPEELLKDNKNDQEYVDKFIKVIKTFEQIYAKKKPRQRK